MNTEEKNKTKFGIVYFILLFLDSLGLNLEGVNDDDVLLFLF